MSTDELMAMIDGILAKEEDGDARFLRHIKEMIEVPRILSEDLAEAAELFQFITHDFAARTFVRTMAAEFEAMLHLLQQLLLLFHADGKFELLPEEVSLLKGETYSLQHGRITSSTKLLPFKENLLFTVKLVSKVYDAEVFVDTSDPRWGSVSDYLRIRNRLMHPKKIEDLYVTDVEVDALNQAQSWIRQSFKSVLGPRISE